MTSGRTPRALRRPERSRRRQRPAGPGRRAHLPGRAHADRACGRALGARGRRPSRAAGHQRPAPPPGRDRARARRTSSGTRRSYILDWMRSWRETRPAIIQLTGDPEPDLFAGLDPTLVAKADPNDARAIYLPLVMERLVNWAIVSAPEPGLGRGRLRRARRRAALGRGRARRCGSTRTIPWRRGRSTPRCSSDARRGPDGGALRRDPLPRPGHRSRRRPARGLALALRDVRDRERDRAPAEPPDRGGLHDARLAPHRGNVSARRTR